MQKQKRGGITHHIAVKLRGTPLDQSTVMHVFLGIARRAGFEGLRLHDLRHSYTSIMIAAGVNIKVISQSLGHANIGGTLDTYGHLMPGMGKKAAEQFDNLLKPWLDKENVGKMSAGDMNTNTRLEGFEPTTPGSEARRRLCWGVPANTNW
jgi:hypothetical protein